MQQAAPLLVHLIENNALQWAGPIIEYYVAPLRAAGITQLILGCTHYGLAYNELQAALPSVDILRQESVLPLKLRDYLRRHPELETKLSRGSSCRYLVTDLPAEGPTWQTAAPELITLPL
jgi:glutamate racemase